MVDHADCKRSCALSIASVQPVFDCKLRNLSLSCHRWPTRPLARDSRPTPSFRSTGRSTTKRLCHPALMVPPLRLPPGLRLGTLAGPHRDSPYCPHRPLCRSRPPSFRPKPQAVRSRPRAPRGSLTWLPRSLRPAVQNTAATGIEEREH